MYSNGYERAARETKAHAIADYLQFQKGVRTAAAIASYNEEQWWLAAAGAGVKWREGNFETRERVVEILRSRERLTAEGLVLDPLFGQRPEAPETEQIESTAFHRHLQWIGGRR